MKLKAKILAALFILVSFTVIFCLNNVSAVGLTYKSWKIILDGEPCLVYRTFTTAHTDAIVEYTSKIIANEGADYLVERY